ncbi:acyltransferase family protein [Spirosoma radiotolerans]|uniref:Heparan-alpha-glucosaminide N-acetyltransferase n=1 Tax=Spirosoma radiotolerans TaxID=1379870 RepID=A0A0E3ZT50_9BACT|nr:heparan-alpha-glucosaminide N-acetyltransferase [Spirosoma radiotolerans]AKD53624.1 heparan-alpha-glucosaminide N-acetyltransferase [Spirosoma radiotolerans]
MQPTTSTQEPALAQPVPIRRLLSLDALRGFDMFWIMGGEEVFHVLAKTTGWAWAIFLADQFTHVTWNGFRPYDCIFPLFLFLAGVSTPYSLGSRLAKGDNRAMLARKVITRGLILVVLGIIYNNGLFMKPFAEMRFGSVLARIGLAGMFAQLIYLYVRSERARYGIFIGILLLYWAMLMLIPVPGFGAGNLTMEGSLVGYVDRLFMPGRLYKVVHDPEGLLSTLPAICTGLLGVFAGTVLRRHNLTDTRKIQQLILAGVSCVALGWVWNSVFPVNKNLWTSSFVLVAGGWSLLILSLFYWIIDVKNWRRWTFFFVVIGMNSILIYLAGRVIDFEYAAHFLFAGLLHFFSEPVQTVGSVVAFLAVKWGFLYFLYKKKTFLRV